MKPTIGIFVLVMAMLAMSVAALGQNQIGDALGNVLHTDIQVEVDGAPISGYNVGGWTYVVVEDLADFGLAVRWNPIPRILEVTRHGVLSPARPLAQSPGLVGSVAFPFVYTDIVTYLNNQRVNGYNIQGRTVVRVDDVAASFGGQVVWNQGQRLLSLDLGIRATEPINPEVFARQFFGLMNEYRNGNGLGPVVWDYDLARDGVLGPAHVTQEGLMDSPRTPQDFFGVWMGVRPNAAMVWDESAVAGGVVVELLDQMLLVVMNFAAKD